MKDQQIEKVKKLKTIYLEYDDGSMIALPEDKTFRVGTAFVKACGVEHIDWHVVKTGRPSLKDKLKKFVQV